MVTLGESLQLQKILVAINASASSCKELRSKRWLNQVSPTIKIA